MVRGGGTSTRNKKKKATDAPTATQNGVENQKSTMENGAEKHKNLKHRKQKEDTPPVIQHQEEDLQQQKESGQGKHLVPTSEQLRLAQITQGDDTNKDPQRKAKINQIMEITGKSEDDVATALFDCNWDETVAIEMLLDEGAGFGSWEETGKKKTKKTDKDETSRENEDFNDDFDPTSDNRERSRNRGPPRLRGRGNSNHTGGRGDSDWKHRENQENERNFEGGRGRGGRGLGPRGRGGHVGAGPRGRGGRGGPRGGGPRPEFDRGAGGNGGEALGQIDTWNPIGAEKQDQRQLRHNKDAFDNAGNWGDDFPAAEDWDNDEYTGSLSDTKVFTPSGTTAKAVGEPVNGQGQGQAAPANNSLSYSQPIDLSSLLKTGGLRDYNTAASQDLKSAIGIGAAPGGGSKPADTGYSGTSLSYSSGSGSSPYNSQHQSSSFNSAAPGSAFSPIKPAAVTNGSGDRGKALPRARMPAPSRIPSSAVEMPGAGGGDGMSNLDVQFGGMDLQFGGSANDSSSNLEFNAAPGQGSTPGNNKDSSYAHSIQSSGGKEDSYKSPPSLAPGSGAVKDVNQSLSSALSAAGIKTSMNNDSVPGYSAGSSGSRSGDKYGSTQRSPGPALISSKSDNMGYNSSQNYPYQSASSGGSKSNYNSYSGSGSSQSYDRQNSSGYSGTNGLNSSYGSASGAGSYNSGSAQASSGYSGSNSGFNSSQPSNNFSSSYGAVTTASYSSFSSNNSYSSKTGSSQNSTSYLPPSTSLSSYNNSADSSTSTASNSKSSYDSSNSTVSAAAGSGGLGLSSVSSSSKMSVNTSSGNKLVPGMPPGVAGVLPAQYMTHAGFPAYLAAGLGQPAAAAAMYGYGGHQLEDLAALQRNTLAASLPQLVGNAAGSAGTPGQTSQLPTKGFGAGAGAGGVATTLAGPGGSSRQDGQNSFGDSNKFNAGSDSTSSPVPSTVGNSVGQPTPFNLASSFTAAAAAQHPTLPPGYAYFYGGVGGMPGMQYGGAGGLYPGTHPGIPVPTAAGPTSTSQFQNKAYGSSYGTGYDSLSQGLSSSGYVNNKYGGSDNNQTKAGGSSNTSAGTGYWSNTSLW